MLSTNRSGVKLSVNNSQTGDAILDRLVQFTGVSTDSALAKELSVSRATVSSWRSRDAVPIKKFMVFANRNNINLNWLLLGEGEPTRDTVSSPLGSSRSLLNEAITHEQKQLDDRLGLGRLSYMARMGTLRHVWTVAEFLPAGSAQALTPEQLGQSCGSAFSQEQIHAYLLFLTQMGIALESPSGAFFRSASFQLESQSSFDRHQHMLHAVELLLHRVLPSMPSGDGKLVTIEGSMNKALYMQLAEQLSEHVKQNTRQTMEKPGDNAKVTVMLALALNQD